MKYKYLIIIPLLFIVLTGCVTKFLPELNENPNLVVVEGMITDQPEIYSVKLSTSMPVGVKTNLKPLKGCTVTVTDDLGNTYFFKETSTVGTYNSDITKFRGITGRKYTLHISTNNSTTNHYSYQSLPMEINPVPGIDSIYYKKVIIREADPPFVLQADGCKIFLNTDGQAENCRFFRWDFEETWQVTLPFNTAINRICWISDKSTNILIKNTSALSENKIEGFMINYITNETDRLSVKYSMLVNQYSLNEDEYLYWDKIKSITEDMGSLYDRIPSSIPGNIFCVEDPEEPVLGYFSVSAKRSRRIFVKSWFNGLVDPYADCATLDTSCSAVIPGLNSIIWLLWDFCFDTPPHKVYTDKKGCVDCTVRGSNIKPDYWTDN